MSASRHLKGLFSIGTSERGYARRTDDVYKSLKSPGATAIMKGRILRNGGEGEKEEDERTEKKTAKENYFQNSCPVVDKEREMGNPHQERRGHIVMAVWR